MKRRLAAALLIVTLPLGMAACHGTKSREATPSTPAPAATANADPTQAPSQAPGSTQAPAPTQAPGASGQSVDEACGLVTSQLKSFSESAGTDATSEQKKAMADATIKALNSPQITNPDVKEAAGKVAAVLTDTVNFANKYESNPSAADQNEANELIARLTTSMYSLGQLCPALLED